MSKKDDDKDQFEESPTKAIEAFTKKDEDNTKSILTLEKDPSTLINPESNKNDDSKNIEFIIEEEGTNKTSEIKYTNYLKSRKIKRNKPANSEIPPNYKRKSIDRKYMYH